MQPQKQFQKLYSRLHREFGQPKTPLHFEKPWQLAIAVILSAQCTDERVNQVTPSLFAKYTSLKKLANAKRSDLERLIFSTGFYKAKAGYLCGFAEKLLKDYGGKLPEDLEELIRLPGIGRKTANVIQQEIYCRSDGVVVDTHVMRISSLFGLTQAKTPKRIEQDLLALIPMSKRRNWSLFLIFLGRQFCTARVRHCESCFLSDICPSSSQK